MKKISAYLLMIGTFFIAPILCRNSSINLNELKAENQKVFTNNTILTINNVPISKGNIDVTVRLTCLTKNNGLAFFYSPSATTFVDSSENSTCSYKYDFRKLKENTLCTLTITTTTYPNLLHRNQPTTSIQDYVFEVAPAGMLSWINPKNW